jgi:Tol biopolymer transport system component
LRTEVEKEKDMTRRQTLYPPALIVAGVLLACAVALIALSEKKAQAAFPGKNGKIAYENFGGGTDAGIYTINPGGRGKSKVAGGIQPAYSPNGNRIAYAGSDGHDLEIYTKNASGGDKRKVTNNSTDDFYPAYSPDGKRIAYSVYNDVGSVIYTKNVSGGARSKLTEGWEPVYSPDGKRIAYTRFVGNTTEIYTIKVGGGDKRQVTHNDKGGNDGPDYSPNGKRIAYAGYDGHDAEIYTIKVDGGGRTQVTDNAKDEEAPSYSPNGKKIAYECFKALGTDDDEDFDHEICTIRVGGGDKTKVTDTAGYASDPSWGSRP